METTSRIMSRIRSSGTKPERLFGSALFGLGVRYRKQLAVIGRPDFGIAKYRIAIFVDGDFWHGHAWAISGHANLESELRRYDAFWRRKIRRNVRRDAEVDAELERLGWRVFRFWASDVERDADKCARKVALFMRRKGYLKRSNRADDQASRENDRHGH